ncbi:hypothetical protein BVZ38_01430A, partial [Haemophilus influenzae]
MKVYFLKEN